MGKIGIVTLNGYYNYGNRLQNYALQEVLKTLGFEVETLIVGVEKQGIKKNKMNFNELSLKKMKNKILFKLKYMSRTSEFKLSKNIRTNVFREFTHKHIRESNYEINENIKFNNDYEFDYYVVGSDQVWNPYYTHGSTVYFLTYTDRYKRVSYAPSFGISNIPEKYNLKYKNLLSEINNLSVREEDGAKIIKELTGIDAPVLVDPTLLLSKQEWLHLSKPATNKPDTNYLLTYFLGGIPTLFKKQINHIAQKFHLKIVNLGDVKDSAAYRTGPSEFIDYIKDCTIFCTNSFHGTVFSILLERPFIVYERPGDFSMYSRMDTLLEKFKFNSRKNQNLIENQNIFDIDFSHVNSILLGEKEKSFKYLLNALDCKEDK